MSTATQKQLRLIELSGWATRNRQFAIITEDLGAVKRLEKSYPEFNYTGLEIICYHMLHVLARVRKQHFQNNLFLRVLHVCSQLHGHLQLLSLVINHVCFDHLHVSHETWAKNSIFKNKSILTLIVIACTPKPLVITRSETKSYM